MKKLSNREWYARWANAWLDFLGSDLKHEKTRRIVDRECAQNAGLLVA